MPFDVEITFGGLGLLVLEGGYRSATPKCARLLMLNHKESPAHYPTCTFFLDDYSGQDDTSKILEPALLDSGHEEDSHPPEQAAKPDIRSTMGPDGKLIAIAGLNGQSVGIDMEPVKPFTAIWNQDAGSTVPSPNNPANALDWLPDAVKDLQLSGIRTDSADLVQGRYAARIDLPGGELSSRAFLFAPNGQPRQIFWDNRPTGVLSELLVARYTKVTRLTLRLDQGDIDLDGKLLEQQGLPPVVKIAFSNIPEGTDFSRYGRPRHTELYGRVTEPITPRVPNISSKPPFGSIITPSGACPPLVYSF